LRHLSQTFLQPAENTDQATLVDIGHFAKESWWLVRLSPLTRKGGGKILTRFLQRTCRSPNRK
jgi:hypothetical protein